MFAQSVGRDQGIGGLGLATVTEDDDRGDRRVVASTGGDQGGGQVGAGGVDRLGGRGGHRSGGDRFGPAAKDPVLDLSD